MLKLLLVNILPVQVRQVLVSHGVVRVGHLVVGPDEALVVRRRALLDAVVLPVVKVPRRRSPAVEISCPPRPLKHAVAKFKRNNFDFSFNLRLLLKYMADGVDGPQEMEIN